MMGFYLLVLYGRLSYINRCFHLFIHISLYVMSHNVTKVYKTVGNNNS